MRYNRNVECWDCNEKVRLFMEQGSGRRHIHYGRVFLFLLLCGVLIFGIFKIADSLKEKPVSVPTADTSGGDAVQFETISQQTSETVQETETAEPTTEYIPPPASIQLEVPYISQKGLLPTGCELVSAKMLLEYYGIEATVNDIIEHTYVTNTTTINGKPYGYSPYTAFIGSPWDESSFGCYPPVIVDMMDQLLPEHKKAVDLTGMELSEIAEIYLPRNMPVMVWATISMLETFPNIGWYLLDEDGEPTDEWYDWKANEHCLVLVGYDEDSYYFNDPYGGRGLVSYSRELVETRYEEIGKCAVVVTDCT